MRRPRWLSVYVVTVTLLSLIAFVETTRRQPESYANPWLYVWMAAAGTAVFHLARYSARRGLTGAASLRSALLMITMLEWGASPALLLTLAWLWVDTTWERRALNITNLALSLVAAWIPLRQVHVYPVLLSDAPLVAAGMLAFMVVNGLLVWIPRQLRSPLALGPYFHTSVKPYLEEYIFDLALALTVANAMGASGLAGGAVIGLLVVSRYRSLQKSAQLQEQGELAIRALVTAMEARDNYTSGHSERVATLARDLALHMGMSHLQAMAVWEAGLLHDVGKMGVPDGILSKSGRLTDEEYRVIQQHAAGSEQILSSRPDWRRLAEVAGQHHEWFNGKGYPRGLAGRQIRLEARMLGVVDAYDAMTSNRAYRPSRSPAAALAEIGRQAGTQFDPFVAKAFIDLMSERLRAEELPAAEITS